MVTSLAMLIFLPVVAEEVMVLREAGLAQAIDANHGVADLHGVPSDTWRRLGLRVERPRLTRVRLFGKAPQKFMSLVASCPHLAILELAGRQWEDSDLAQLRHSRTLDSVRIRNTRITGLSFGAFPNAPLRSVSVYKSPFDNKGVEELVRFATLERLSIKQSCVSQFPPPGCASPQLHTLNLGFGCVLDPGSCENIACYPKLSRLSLDIVECADEDMHWIAKLEELTELSLYGNPITDRGIAALTSLSNLHSLELGHTKVTDNGCLLLAEMVTSAELRSINLHATAVTTDGVLALLQTRKLEQLSFANADVSREGLVEMLTEHPVHSLCVSPDQLSETQIRHLIDTTAISTVMVRDFDHRLDLFQ